MNTAQAWIRSAWKFLYSVLLPLLLVLALAVASMYLLVVEANICAAGGMIVIMGSVLLIQKLFFSPESRLTEDEGEDKEESE